MRAAAVLALAAALFGAYGLGRSGYVGYDTLFGLIWGRDFARLELPDFAGPFAPTPHPLLNLVGALLSPLGSAAPQAMEVLGLAATVLLGVAAFRLGRAVGTPAVGALLALLLLTRPEPIRLALYSALDIPYIALVLMAAALEAERSRRGMPVLALLGLAGLLRPEAWMLAVAYALHAGWHAARRRRAALLVAAAVAPGVWILIDVIVTGDLFHSLTGARAAASDRGLPQGVGPALSAVPDFSQQLLGMPILIGAGVGAVFAARQARRKMALPASLGVLALVPFLAYGLAGSAFFPRYLLPTAAVLTLLCAIGALGWTALPRGHPRRIPWMVAGGTVTALLLASAPARVGDLADVRAGVSHRAALEEDLKRLVEEAGGPRALTGCPHANVPEFRLVPLFQLWLELPAERFSSRPPGERANGLRVTVPRAARRSYVLDPLRFDPVRAWQRQRSPGLPVLARSDAWELAGRCREPRRVGTAYP